MQSAPLGARLFTIAACALLVAACATTPVAEPPPPAPAPAPTPAPAPAPAPTPVTPAVPPAAAIDPLKDPSNILSKREVFFDFDRFDIKPEFIPLVEAHGRFLVANTNRRVVIEGHTDERGSREYNLALGQRRADAVRSRLTLLGASANQIETISFGEERPRAQGSNEAAWAQNRRADIVYR